MTTRTAFGVKMELILLLSMKSVKWNLNLDCNSIFLEWSWIHCTSNGPKWSMKMVLKIVYQKTIVWLMNLGLSVLKCQDKPKTSWLTMTYTLQMVMGVFNIKIIQKNLTTNLVKKKPNMEILGKSSIKMNVRRRKIEHLWLLASRLTQKMKHWIMEIIKWEEYSTGFKRENSKIHTVPSRLFRTKHTKFILGIEFMYQLMLSVLNTADTLQIQWKWRLFWLKLLAVLWLY
jgi:hypothetical protein